ncbi:MAG: hypothetical protein WAT39_05105 [Planctomycetota bacterium]
MAGALVLAACSGGLSQRSTAEMADKVPVGQGIRCVRIELENGTIGIANGTDRAADYAGGVRRAADTAADLAKIEQVAFRLEVRPDAARPDTLILAGPRMPEGVVGLLSLELGLRLPPEIELEVAITGSGHITVGERKARVLASTGRGDLRFEACRGPVKADTGRGTVIAFDHAGDLDILTKVGDMTAFVREPASLIRLVSGQGTVQCGVPEGTGFDLDARAETGFVGAGFGLAAERVGEFGSALVARQGSGATRVVLRTGSGHLAFKPKKFD